MCSICGGNYPLEMIRATSNVMVHRGPDSSGIYTHQDITLAHNRLSIVDLDDEANQPFISSFCPHLVLVFNGEIYNYLELIRKFCLPVQTKSDSEVLLLLFDRLGEKCLEEINGMFAFAIYNKQTNKIFLARDRYGKKPLFYLKNGNRFAFASEARALRGVSSVVLNEEAVKEYLCYLAPCGANSFFKEIQKLEAGYFLIYDFGTEELKIFCYYDFMSDKLSSKYYQDGKKNDSFENAKNNVLSLLYSSLDYRLVGDASIASFLSGGLDSSLISALYSKKQRINTFSIGYKEYKKRYCELEYAKKVAKFIRSNHHEIVIDKKDFIVAFDGMMEKWDEPINDPAMIPIYILSSKLRDFNFKVVLSGEGSDELFYGYDAVHRFLEYANSPNNYNFSLLDVLNARRVQRIIKNNHPAYRMIVESWSDNEIDLLYGKKQDEHKYFSEKWREFKSKNCLADWCSYIDFKHWIADVLMVKMDRASMLQSIESRSPFLDYRLVDFVMGLDGSFKIRGESKILLREIARENKLLPEEIIARNKKGFSSPYFEWYFEEYRDRILQDYLELNNQLGLFNNEYLKFLFAEGRLGNMKSQNWAMIVLVKWLKMQKIIQ